MKKLRGLFLVSISLTLTLILALVLTGCVQPPPEPVPVPEPAPAPAPVPQPEPEPAPPPAPSVSPGSTAKFEISKPPKVGETIDLIFILDVTGPLKPVTRVWLEFERYDPALYYPLGRGRGRERSLEELSKLNPADAGYFYLAEALKDQPDSVVPPETVVVSGNVNREGPPLMRGDMVILGGTVRFQEAGEWLVSARWQVEGEKPQTRTELYLTVNQDDAMFGWPKDFSQSGRVIPDEMYSFHATLKPSRAPLLGEPFELTMVVQSVRDVSDGEVYLSIFRRVGPNRVDGANELIQGDLAWKGSLEKGALAELSGTLRFLEEGDWAIDAWSRSSPESISRHMHSIFLHVGKDASRFGWTESHERKDIPPPPPLKGGAKK